MRHIDAINDLNPAVYSEGLTNTTETSQAGHHTHQTTTCVHRPHTVHPKAASISTVSTLTPDNWHTAKNTTGGDKQCSTTFDDSLFQTGKDGWILSSPSAKGTPRKEKGKESSPMKKAREKFRVARVARNMPKSKREKHLIKRHC